MATPWTLSAFSGLSQAMSLEQILARWGTPERQDPALGSTLRYRLADGSHLDIVYGAPHTLKCVHYRCDGTRMSWIPS